MSDVERRVTTIAAAVCCSVWFCLSCGTRFAGRDCSELIACQVDLQGTFPRGFVQARVAAGRLNLETRVCALKIG